jgi:hypothetical protein
MLYCGEYVANVACRGKLEADFVLMQVAIRQATPIIVVVPPAARPPGTPGHVVLILAVGITGLAVSACAGLDVEVLGMGGEMLGHCRPGECGGKNCGNAKKGEFRHGILLFVSRKAKSEPHVKLYADPRQTQLKKYLFRLFAIVPTIAVQQAIWFFRDASD